MVINCLHHLITIVEPCYKQTQHGFQQTLTLFILFLWQIKNLVDYLKLILYLLLLLETEQPFLFSKDRLRLHEYQTAHCCPDVVSEGHFTSNGTFYEF